MKNKHHEVNGNTRSKNQLLQDRKPNIQEIR